MQISDYPSVVSGLIGIRCALFRRISYKRTHNLTYDIIRFKNWRTTLIYCTALIQRARARAKRTLAMMWTVAMQCWNTIEINSYSGKNQCTNVVILIQNNTYFPLIHWHLCQWNYDSLQMTHFLAYLMNLIAAYAKAHPETDFNWAL